jgi:hypothetical protein
MSQGTEMDFKAIVDLVKYTLAICAASFVYSLEKLTPAPTETGRWFALGLLAIFVASSLFGILIFSSATAAMHDKSREEGQKKVIKFASYGHLGLLGLGVLLLGGRLVDTVLTPPPPAPPLACCVEQAGR